MKKIIYTILITFFLPTFLMAEGRIAEIWTQPAVFKADEAVSFYFDVTGTDLDGETEGIYMWSWFPSEPDAGNWENSSEFTALTQVEGNLWKIELTPSEYYGVEASGISAFYGLLKNKNGSKATDAFAPDTDPPNDINIYSLAAISADAIIDYFPKDFTINRPVSILVNANNTFPDQCGDNPIQGDLANAPNIHVHGGVNDWTVVVENNSSNLDKTELTHLGDGIYRWDMIPQDYFGLEEDFAITNISAVFASNDWAFIGKNVNCSDFFIQAPDQPEPVIPTLTFFPQKISKKDILCIFRANNETNISKLSYTITAGSEIINGDFVGNTKEMSAYVNMVDLLKNVEGIDKINVLIKDNNGRKVADNDIPLVQLND